MTTIVAPISTPVNSATSAASVSPPKTSWAAAATAASQTSPTVVREFGRVRPDVQSAVTSVAQYRSRSTLAAHSSSDAVIANTNDAMISPSTKP